jgi:hypothetical protein
MEVPPEPIITSLFTMLRLLVRSTSLLPEVVEMVMLLLSLNWILLNNHLILPLEVVRDLAWIWKIRFVVAWTWLVLVLFQREKNTIDVGQFMKLSILRSKYHHLDR